MILALIAIVLFVLAAIVRAIFGDQLITNKTMSAANSPSMKTQSRILEGKTIVIDPGHGGKDVGATGQTGIHEKALTLQTALNIQKELQERTGANVILTRNQDEFLTLTERVDTAKGHSADLFISIHCDAFTSKEAGGMTTYYYHAKDQELAHLMHNQLFKPYLNTRDRGVELGDFQVLRESESPSILLELGYISNPEDEQRIQSQAFQTHAAKTITDGIISFLK